MGELRKLRIAGTENTVTPYTAADDTVVITNHTVKVNTNKIATKTDLDGKVDKEIGKGLSTNDFTTAEKNKLAGIEAQANKTVVDDELSDQSENPVQNKVIDAKLVDLKAEINQISESIAPVESTTTATAAHAVGELFMVGETLMVALSAIAVGDTITTDGGSPNAAVTTLSSKLLKDVQVNGTSIVNQGVANVPFAGYGIENLGVVQYSNAYGISVSAAETSKGQMRIYKADSSTIKTGEHMYRPIVPYGQHESTFYGLAKAASDTTQSQSSNPVGTYTDAAKVAIQKMLGVYEAPWELIREDTVTNETDAPVIITVDGNGQPFELTDIRMLFQTPVQETQAIIGQYGRTNFYYSPASYDCMYLGAYTQNANAPARTGMFSIEQRDGMIEKSMVKNAQDNGEYNIQIGNIFAKTAINGRWVMVSPQRVYTKIVLDSLTGTIQYRLYGKRKWS